MTREELARKSFYDGTHDFNDGKSEYFRGIEWADQHPRKGLWDANKVIKWLQDNADSYIWYDETENECGITDNFIKNLQKAMED